MAAEAHAGEAVQGCGAEVVSWSYDAERQVLSLSDGSVQLNCCGQRSIQVERVDNVIEVTERDRPDEGGRCASSCTFDLSTSVAQVGSGEVFVKLLRDVTDENGSPVLVWQGNLDLTKTAGHVAMEEAAPGPCEVAAR
ncbi:Hypothetical protein CAP_7312 [Chondromyces apiculatus DSM 436]|uniref:Uncharacterized protein n=2 Tax=Chondromyces apiculatus TaxID=51 RepID=A0A017T051_9BACT|nr:Hypothetical protein CAP_7312 [Chondromyces apiculatus DSM 436]